MSIVLSTPRPGDVAGVVRVMREWQRDGESVPLHPGDLGWYWRFGAEALAGAVRTWSRDGQILAAGLLDGDRLVRLAVAPAAEQDEELAQQLAADVSAPERGVLPAGNADVEARFGGPFRRLLHDAGWTPGEPWSPLARDLSRPVEAPGIRIEVVGPDRVAERVAVQRAAFDRSTFTVERWHAMAAAPPYADARCLLGYDDQGNPVAAVTVWSAGAGRPGLLEPMGVHRDHRGRGHGRAITVAAAAALRDLGSSSALVCTPSANAGGVATYRSAGFRHLPEARDLHRDAAAR